MEVDLENVDVDLLIDWIIGKACFLCTDERRIVEIGDKDDLTCPLCISPSITLDRNKGQRVLEHIGAHILFDPKVKIGDDPCGVCLRPAPLCVFHFRKTKGSVGGNNIDLKMSTCPVKLKYYYGKAEEHTASSPCSNVPVWCKFCEKTVWRYNFRHHFRTWQHPTQSTVEVEHLWKISNAEKAGMKVIWKKRQHVPIPRKKKMKAPPLVVSLDYMSNNGQYVPSFESPSI